MQERHPKSHPTAEMGPSQVSAVAGAQTFEKASEAYTAQSATPGVKKFEVAGRRELDGGLTEITYAPPEYKGKECPKELLVVQTFDQQGDVVKVNPGTQANCITPPVKQQDGSFKFNRYDQGAEIDVKAAHYKVERNRESLNGHNTGAGGKPPPRQTSANHLTSALFEE